MLLVAFSTLANLALSADELAKGFAVPPDSAKPWTYWFWINGNITREGITADLEAMARVSAQAVSLALRNHPSIGEATRRRIHQVAQRAGYRPDPQVAKLMHHLRAGRGQRTNANVCALTTRPARVRETFCDLLLQGRWLRRRRRGFPCR